MSAFDAGLRLLGMRAHSQVELRRKLARRLYPSVDIDSAIVRLVDLGYLDDSAFAAGVVRGRRSSRGPRAISQELASKGIGRDGIQVALGQFDREGQLVSAEKLASRLASRAPVATYREMLDRVGAKLMRRGFSPDVVRAACRSVLEGTAKLL